MRNISTKVDNTDTLPAAAFNSDQDELENVVTSSDQTLDPNAGPDTDLNMLAKAIAGYANAGATYQESGIANAYVLAISSNLKSVTKYFDNMTVIFKAGNSSTGASTINVASLGVKNITLADGTALTSNDIVTGKYAIAVYNLSADRFEIVSSFNDPEGVVQRIYTSDGEVATGTNVSVADDSIPQTSELNQFMSLAITPTNAANKLLVRALLHVASDGVAEKIAAITKDAGTAALAVGVEYAEQNRLREIYVEYEVIAGGTSAITFKAWAACAAVANTITFNGVGGVRRYGGVIHSFMEIIEYKA